MQGELAARYAPGHVRDILATRLVEMYHDAAGAVAGFNAATGSVLDDIVEWADREAAARSAR